MFYFVFEGNFPDFLRYPFGGLIFGGAYTWRGLFSNFTVCNTLIINRPKFVSNFNFLSSGGGVSSVGKLEQ